MGHTFPMNFKAFFDGKLLFIHHFTPANGGQRTRFRIKNFSGSVMVGLVMVGSVIDNKLLWLLRQKRKYTPELRKSIMKYFL